MARAGPEPRQRFIPKTVLANALTGGGGDTVFVGGKPRHVMSYMQDFLFTPAAGAHARSRCCRAASGRGCCWPSCSPRRPIFLVLDEPTNDLDLETLDLLEEMMGDYPGTALVVSHDRDFLDRVATQIVMAEGDGRFTDYAGGYSDMLAQRGEGVVKTPAKAERKEAKVPPRA